MCPSSAFRYLGSLLFQYRPCHDPHSGVITKSILLISQCKHQGRDGPRRPRLRGLGSGPGPRGNACLAGIPPNPALEFVTPGTADFTGPAAVAGRVMAASRRGIFPSSDRVLSVKTTSP
jgi:hypothetical protein